MLFVAILYVALVGISFDLSSQRNKAASILTQNLGRQVRLDGSLQLEISARPKLHLGGLHIANAPGFAGNEFVSLGEAHLKLNLWSLLRLRFQIAELSGRDVHIRLQVSDKGNNNWTLGSTEKKPAAIQTTSTDQAAKMEVESLLAHLDIERVSLEKLNVEFIGSNARSHYFELQSLIAHFPAGKSLTLTLNGTVEKSYPYKLDLTGGSLVDLVSFDKPWPIDLTLGFLSTQLALHGNASRDNGSIKFDLDTRSLNELERLLQTQLPAVGIARLSGSIKYAPGTIALDNLSGIMGKTTLNGALDFNYNGDHPKIQGGLTLPTLDLRPFMTGKPASEDEPPKSLSEIYQELAKATFNLQDLNNIDADLTLRVGKLLKLPGEVHDAMLQVKLEHGRLSVPMQASMADVALSGIANVDARMSQPRFSLALGTHDSNLGNLADVLAGIPDVKGKLNRFDLHVAARGNNGAELVRSIDVRLNIKRGELTYGNVSGGHPVQFLLDDLVLSLPAGKPLYGETHGTLLNKPFNGKLHGGSLSDIMQEAHTPIDFEMRAGSAKVQIHAFLQPPAKNSGSEITFNLTAPHSGEISSWLGLKEETDAPIGLHGNFHTEKNSWHLSNFALQLGHTDLSADVQHIFYQGKPLIKLRLTSDLIDVDELEALLPEGNENPPATAAPATESLINIPILPKNISLADADLTVRIERIASKSPLTMRNLHFDGHIRDGMMSASPFSANVAENDFSGSILLDLRSQQPHSVLQLSADTLDIGRMLNKLGIARNIDADIDHLNLQLDLHSSHLGKILAKSEMAISFKGGHLTLHDANTGGKMRIALDDGELKSAAGAPVYLDLNGSLDKIPLSISIQTANAADLINPVLPIPFKFKANTPDATFKLSGDIERPFTKEDIELALDMSGSRMDHLDFLAHTSLPPWGPWSASGKFLMSPRGYEVSSLLLQVGSSRFTGHGKFDTQVVPPRIDIALDAPTIQLDDFRTGNWSAEKAKPKSKAKSDDDLGKEAEADSEQVQKILSPEALKRQNAYLTVRVDQVMSGQDTLGNGSLDAKLENGRALIGPVIVNTPGGSASLKMGYAPGEKDVAVNLRAEVKRLDYGILARRIDKKSEMSGIFSLNVDVSARAQYLSEILRYGKGHIDFAIWPQNLKAGLLDLWAVNVLMALLPAVDSSNESKVNCAIGRFELRDGKLSDKTILIDTSRMRVSGKGGAAFAEEDVQLYVHPRAKIPQFMSLAIPIQVNGKFDDFHVGVSPADILETVGEFFTSIVWVPLERLFGKEMPADGHDVCAAIAF